MNRLSRRLSFLLLLAAAMLSGCSGIKPADDLSHLLTFTTQLRGANEVPPVSSIGSGQVDAVLNKDSNLLRWKLSYANLSGPATAGRSCQAAPQPRNWKRRAARIAQRAQR